jgi:hypothetical protein
MALKHHTTPHHEEQKETYVPIGLGVALDECHLDTSNENNSFIVEGESARERDKRNNGKNPWEQQLIASKQTERPP